MSEAKITFYKDKEGNTRISIDYHDDDNLPAEHNEAHIKLCRDLGIKGDLNQDRNDDDQKAIKVEQEVKQVIKSDA